MPVPIGTQNLFYSSETMNQMSSPDIAPFLEDKRDMKTIEKDRCCSSAEKSYQR